MKISFSRIDPKSEPRGFDMGNISIELDCENISSHGNPRDLMMIYIAISDLIFGVLRLNDARGIYNFVGADSSFWVIFKSKGKQFEISRKEGRKIVCGKIDFFNALCAGLKDFFASGNELKIYDSVNADLQLAIKKLNQVKCKG